MGSIGNLSVLCNSNRRLGNLSVVQLVQKEKGYSRVTYTDGSYEDIECDYFGPASEIEDFIVFIIETTTGDAPVTYVRKGVIKKIEIKNGKM